jgi:hypothetical protein
VVRVAGRDSVVDSFTADVNRSLDMNPLHERARGTLRSLCA